ncbi:MAG: helix-turn-helix domain-containing protein [Deltaproteobacteria bacterium]|nr:helix-turn-helix domain-containing protein [Deltaproteobacteria bacterium]
MIAEVNRLALEFPVNNPHQNDRTPVFSRALIVQRVCREGEKGSEVARQLGISRRTVHKRPLRGIFW